MAEICCREWGLYETVTSNLQKVRQFIKDDVSVQCIGMEATEMVQKVDAIRDSLASREKGFGWRARAMLGKRVKWYDEVIQEAV
jgi:hypothetical protein